MATSVFASRFDRAWPHRFHGALHVDTIAGGTPTDSKVAEGWLRSKLTDNRDELIREKVAETMLERGVGVEEATEIVDELKHLNGFKRERCANCPPEGLFCTDGTHPLFIEGRQLKAALKEAASIAVSSGRLAGRGWGKTNKGLLNFLAEHVMVVEDRLYLGVDRPTGIAQRFIHTFRGAGIQYEEYVEDAKIDFTVISDYDFSEDEWAEIWLKGEQNGIGASRSQGFGKYQVTRWDMA